jgi:hypothetical protein
MISLINLVQPHTSNSMQTHEAVYHLLNTRQMDFSSHPLSQVSLLMRHCSQKSIFTKKTTVEYMYTPNNAMIYSLVCLHAI